MCVGDKEEDWEGNDPGGSSKFNLSNSRLLINMTSIRLNGIHLTIRPEEVLRVFRIRRRSLVEDPEIIEVIRTLCRGSLATQIDVKDWIARCRRSVLERVLVLRLLIVIIVVVKRTPGCGGWRLGGRGRPGRRRLIIMI